MRSLIFAALILAPAALAAQDSTPPGTDVERIGLQPGESASFTLASGNEHQLLHRAAPNARGAITISYSVAGGQSTISAVSHLGYPTRFSVLADPERQWRLRARRVDRPARRRPGGDPDLAGRARRDQCRPFRRRPARDQPPIGMPEHARRASARLPAVDDLDEGRAVTVELGGADAGDARQSVDRGRLQLRHLAQACCRGR